MRALVHGACCSLDHGPEAPSDSPRPGSAPRAEARASHGQEGLQDRGRGWRGGVETRARGGVMERETGKERKRKRKRKREGEGEEEVERES